MEWIRISKSEEQELVESMLKPLSITKSRKCLYCGKEFMPTCPMNTYCSYKCREKSQKETAIQYYTLNKKKINAKRRVKKTLDK